MNTIPIPNHATLPDMPSASNADHDGRYYTIDDIDTMLNDGTVLHGSLGSLGTGSDHSRLDIADLGTAEASKALVVNAQKDIAGLRNITASGTITGSQGVFGTLLFTGNTILSLVDDNINFNFENLVEIGDIEATGTISGSQLIAGSLTLASNSINSGTGTIGFGNDNLVDIVNITASGDLSIDDITATGLITANRFLANPTDSDPTNNNTEIIASFSDNTSGTKTTGGTKIIAGVKGEVNTIIDNTSGAGGAGLLVLRGLDFFVQNAANVGGAFGRGVDYAGVSIESILGGAGQTVNSGSNCLNTAFLGKTTLDGTINANVNNYGLRIIQDNLIDDGSGTINNYGVHLAVAVSDSNIGSGGTLTSWGFYSSTAVDNLFVGNLRIGSNVAPVNTLDVTGAATIGDGGVTNYTEISATGDLTFVGTAGLVYGGIYVKDSSATISIDQDNADVLITQWTTNSFSNNCTPNVANNKIQIDVLGVYEVIFHATVDIDSGSTIKISFEGYLDGTIQPMLHADRTVAGTGIGSVSFIGLIDVTTVPWDLDVRANSNSSAARTLTIEDAQLIVKQISGT